VKFLIDAQLPARLARERRRSRDLGFAVGAVLSGVIADAAGIGTAIVVVALITAASGADVAIRMREPLHRPPLPPTKRAAADA
jgi:hypothetical protein